MRTFSETELRDILEKHKLWHCKKGGGKRADLSNADLRGVDLRDVDLCNADLSGANLFCADLSGANLFCAELRGANLRDADLRDADLCNADLRGAKNVDDITWNGFTAFYPMQCPESGAFIGYKKASRRIVKLEICEDALRSSATTRKCRCSKAKVLEIQNYDGTRSDLTSVASNYDPSFIYTVGEIVEVKNFDTNRWEECAPGIHFFITRDEAVKY